MKKYLLKPHKRLDYCKNEIWLVKSEGLNDCWRFIKDKYFLCIHFIYDKDRMLRTIPQEDVEDPKKIIDFIKESDV